MHIINYVSKFLFVTKFVYFLLLFHSQYLTSKYHIYCTQCKNSLQFQLTQIKRDFLVEFFFIL